MLQSGAEHHLSFDKERPFSFDHQAELFFFFPPSLSPKSTNGSSRVLSLVDGLQVMSPLFLPFSLSPLVMNGRRRKSPFFVLREIDLRFCQRNRSRLHRLYFPLFLPLDLDTSPLFKSRRIRLFFSPSWTKASPVSPLFLLPARFIKSFFIFFFFLLPFAAQCRF